jgi:hypothetical protein
MGSLEFRVSMGDKISIPDKPSDVDHPVFATAKPSTLLQGKNRL